MRSLTAVRTTGIYCRAGCAGRPKIENIELFEHPAAAESAGYRACLRCRPDQLPVVGAPSTAPLVVCRALELINDGFLDTGSEAALGTAVGMHHRQLRRLFDEHIGTSATKVARSRRAHFARRLLDETNLSIEDVSYASGFRSPRQCRRVVKETFEYSPTELRKRRRKGSVIDLDGGIGMRLPTPAGYPAEKIFSFIAKRATPGIEVVEGTSYRRTVVTCGHVGVVEVEAVPSKNQLVIKAHLATLRELPLVVSCVRALFGLRSSNRRAVQALSRDPLLASYIDRSSVFVPGAWTQFESAIRIIIGQQVSVAGATTVTGQLASLSGIKAPSLEKFGLSRCFPTPSQIVKSDLSRLGMPSRRRQTIKAYAEWTLAGKVPTVERFTDVEKIVDELQQIPGIGPWTANVIALRALGLPDAFPAGDLGVRKGATVVLGTKTLIRESDLTRLAQRWRPYRSVAATLLWDAACHYKSPAKST